ncbi:MAG: hypothetical protein JWM27_2117 [Gemmatimonadetes bacterium]|nr:hypothetical protein [Gemmatimonadota bacterium]
MPPRRWVPLLAALLAAAPLARAAAQAQPDPRRTRTFGVDSLAFRGVAADAGIIWPLRIESTTILNLRADLGPVSPGVRLVPTLSFWASRFHTSELRRLARQIEKVCAAQHGVDCPPLDLGEVRVSDLSLGLDAQVSLRRLGPLQPYFSVGGAMHLLNGQGDAIDNTFVEGLLDAIAPGLQASGGLELPLSHALRLYGEGRAVLGSDTRYVGLTVGASWRLPVASAPTSPSASGGSGR